MLKQKLKAMVLTGAAVMVLMSTAAPTAAMAAPAGYQGVYPGGGTIAIGDINSGGNTGNTIPPS